jgi:hypothetical protein
MDPNICTAFGDPFSPWTQHVGPRPLHLSIRRVIIPPDYPHDILRIELFNPDSINTSDANGSLSTFRKRPLQLRSHPLSPGRRRNELFYRPPQRDLCILETGELDIVAETDGAISEAQINPYWYVRTNAQPGGRQPDSRRRHLRRTVDYTHHAINTQTVYELHYHAEHANGDIQLDLALADTRARSGTAFATMATIRPICAGVTGGGSTGDYPTRQRPVIPVPTDNNFGSFEINLTSDVPDIWVDPLQASGTYG